MASVDVPTGPCAPWRSSTVLELLPDLSTDEKQRMRLQGYLPERDEDIPRVPPVPQYQVPCVRSYDDTIMTTVCHALRHYNATHPGGEFDAVKPLMEDGVHYRGEAWSHINFWARSRSSNKIKRFFAEVHYKPPECSDPSFLPSCIATVETCTIIEEPLAQYKRTCAFCHSYFDILHPMDDSEFVCGNGNEEDWNVQELFGLRFICRKGEAFPFDEDEDENEGGEEGTLWMLPDDLTMSMRSGIK